MDKKYRQDATREYADYVKRKDQERISSLSREGKLQEMYRHYVKHYRHGFGGPMSFEEWYSALYTEWLLEGDIGFTIDLKQCVINAVNTVKRKHESKT